MSYFFSLHIKERLFNYFFHCLGKPFGPVDVKINTRRLHVNKGCDNVADFTFLELADQPNGTFPPFFFYERSWHL